MADKTFTTYEIAKFCDVYPSTIINWIEEGKLKAHSTPGGHNRVTGPDLLAFFKKFDMPIPPELQAARRVLIVDDDVEVRRCLIRAFQRHPGLFRPEACGSGIEALLKIGIDRPDLVVLDIVLPGMDGIEVCRIMKAKPDTRGIKIVGISGERPMSEAKRKEYAVDAFFRKPLDLVELTAKAAELLNLDLPAAATRGT